MRFDPAQMLAGAHATQTLGVHHGVAERGHKTNIELRKNAILRFLAFVPMKT